MRCCASRVLRGATLVTGVIPRRAIVIMYLAIPRAIIGRNGQIVESATMTLTVNASESEGESMIATVNRATHSHRPRVRRRLRYCRRRSSSSSSQQHSHPRLTCQWLPCHSCPIPTLTPTLIPTRCRRHRHT